MYLKEVQERKDRRKQNLVDRKCATNQRKLQEKVKMSKEAEIKRCKTEGQDENFWLGEPQCLPPSRPCTRHPVLRSGPARVYGVNASEGFQKLPTIQRQGACGERKFLERTKTSQESLIKECTAKLPDENPSEPSLGEPRGLLPLRPRMGRPVLRSGTARLYGVKISEAYQKLPSLELICSDQS
ncbi:hypothetical protein SKAU_G00047560 [Synaphobranchus kaupii]|uniref:Uncharacterized protein n=1 Tax=Synaphobranchus kaupii TaxID=118154 RepID=A0A9Q1J8C1_SYNKA|nr:hypothetical protein SKAU_G00047560 [Synaphobranchus kaupii]